MFHEQEIISHWSIPDILLPYIDPRGRLVRIAANHFCGGEPGDWTILQEQSHTTDVCMIEG